MAVALFIGVAAFAGNGKLHPITVEYQSNSAMNLGTTITYNNGQGMVTIEARVISNFLMVLDGTHVTVNLRDNTQNDVGMTYYFARGLGIYEIGETGAPATNEFTTEAITDRLIGSEGSTLTITMGTTPFSE